MNESLARSKFLLRYLYFVLGAISSVVLMGIFMLQSTPIPIYDCEPIGQTDNYYICERLEDEEI